MPLKQPASATVITGFLGAGKTTLIKRLLSEVKNKRLALIINEFGDIGIDASLISDLGEKRGRCSIPACRDEDIIELSNGCICCTVADDFLPTMQQLVAQTEPPEHIIIETSGLALPQPLVQAFNWPDIRASVRLDGVIALVDGPALHAGGFVQDMAALEAQRAADEEVDHESPVEDLFLDQIRAANLILVSKSDVLNSDSINAVCQKITHSLHHKTPIIPVSAQSGSLPVLLGLDGEEEAFSRSAHSHHHHHEEINTQQPAYSRQESHRHGEDHTHKHSHEHGHYAFESRVLMLPVLQDGVAFASRLSEVAEEFGMLRAKGRLAVAGKMLPLIVQAVGRRVDSYFGKAANQGDNEMISALVVIGFSDMDFDGIANALDGSWRPALPPSSLTSI